MSLKGDELDQTRIAEITKKIPEEILLIRKVIKFSKKNYQQGRVVVITKTSLYNLDDTILKRTVMILSIEGISLSLVSNQFTLHIPSEFDTRYKSQSRDAIVFAILKSRHLIGESSLLPLFIVRTGKLESITTTEEDAKKNRRKSVHQHHQMVCYRTYGLILYRYMSNQPEVQILYASEHCKPSLIRREYKRIMRIGASPVCEFQIIKCTNTADVYCVKTFFKKHLATDVCVFRAFVMNYSPNKYLQKLLLIKQKQDKFQLVFQFYNGDLYGQLKAQHSLPEVFLLHLALRMLLVIRETDQVIYSIHPENILLDNLGNPHLSLFSMHFRCNVPDEYCSPQEIQFLQGGSAILNPKMANVWKLGICLFELAYGVPPFPLVEIISAVSSGRQFNPRFPGIEKSKAFRRFLKQVLKLSPQNRLGFKNFEELFQSSWLGMVDMSTYGDWDTISLKQHLVKIQMQDNYSQTIQYYYS